MSNRIIRLARPLIVLWVVIVTTAVASDKAVSPAELFYESLALHRQGKIAEAVIKLEQLEKLDPDNPNVIANLAQFSGEAGFFQKATHYFKKLMLLEPDNIQAEVGYALYESLDLAQAKRYPEALTLLKRAVVKAPNNGSILWNLALFSAETDKHDQALNYWSRLAKLEPENMHIQSKIIQAYQALEDVQNRDRALERLMAMHHSNADPDFIKQNRFCREQYRLGTWKVFVFEYFDPGKKNLFFYRYSVTDLSEQEQFWVSLGSYQTTTDFARATGSIPPSDRMYHLDYYDKGKHATWGMYTKKPSYDELRRLTREMIAQEIRRITNSERP